MWARKRLDIGYTDLACGLLDCLLPHRCDVAERLLAEAGQGKDTSFVACTSVRSGFDLLLQVLQLPQGSEILISAITIPDIPRIIKHHGLVPVPIDIDPQSAAPQVSLLPHAHSPRTRALIVAHLFGSRVPLEPYVEFARQHNLMLIEDCAQAYCGPPLSGNSESDVCLFSFGPIKAATALAGGMIRVRDQNLAQRMRVLQAAYPLQTRRSYFMRLCKYSLLKVLSSRWLFGFMLLVFKVCRINHDQILNVTVKSYAVEELFEKLRQRPCTPLVIMLRRRLRNFNPAIESEIIRRGQELVHRLEPSVHCPAGSAVPHTYWVFPIMIADPQALIQHLKQAGFDATQGGSMVAVQPPVGSSNLSAKNAENLLSEIVYLPFYPALPESELHRMTEEIEHFVRESTKTDS